MFEVHDENGHTVDTCATWMDACLRADSFTRRTLKLHRVRLSRLARLSQLAIGPRVIGR